MPPVDHYRYWFFSYFAHGGIAVAEGLSSSSWVEVSRIQCKWFSDILPISSWFKKSPEHRVSNIFVLISSWKYNIVHKYLFFCSYSLILSILNTMKLQEYSTWLSIQVSILLFSWFRHWENYLIKFINRKQHIAVSPWVWRSRKISFLRKIRRDKTHGEDCSTY